MAKKTAKKSKDYSKKIVQISKMTKKTQTKTKKTGKNLRNFDWDLYQCLHNLQKKVME